MVVGVSLQQLKGDSNAPKDVLFELHMQKL